MGVCGIAIYPLLQVRHPFLGVYRSGYLTRYETALEAVDGLDIVAQVVVTEPNLVEARDYSVVFPRKKHANTEPKALTADRF